MSRNPHYIKMINSARWKQLRAKKLRSNPVCEVCESNNRSTIATEVHHIVPVESVPHEFGMRQLMFNYNNLQSLCHACHVEIHRRAFSHSKEAVQANNERATQRFVDKFLKEPSENE
ncbi:HNH endonuclease signature motif containing protein [Bacteroides sp.]|uniref:HNH endonuclease n=1 Tax=Bacteroides sp. TaxID=29523 RepID=UPI0026050C3F|nr:HNH endonuclease signature motif containing protein [Bacteroides sp.]MDD3038268.1 HNH endonuclease signature motif containing protein [Bacteroides sp.]